MSMFCFQCQEAARGEGCTVVGVCGKTATTAALQDGLIQVARGVAIYATALAGASLAGAEAEAEAKAVAEKVAVAPAEAHAWLRLALFTTITNANFDDAVIEAQIRRGLAWRLELQQHCAARALLVPLASSHAASWCPTSREQLLAAEAEIGVLRGSDSNVRSLRELLTYGLKGLAAYLHHAAELGSEDNALNTFLARALAATANPDLDGAALTALVLETGGQAVAAMALLDGANTGRYGHPEVTQVRIGVGQRPGILVSGHDLADLEELLEQSRESGIDIYTHSEMLPAHSYPAFKTYPHLYGNYGNAWWQQHREFTSFRGPILFTTNCIMPPPKDAAYAAMVFTTGAAGFPGYRHIERGPDGRKDFAELIALAQGCAPPEPLEKGTIPAGFAHHQVEALAAPILEAIHSGALKRFVVMAGCEGRQLQRSDYTRYAKELPSDTVILTAGCAKYRYNKLDLGVITAPGGVAIPRVLDAGQCNDSYSLVRTALLLKHALGLQNINDLPIDYTIAWYEQKAVIVLLALLHLGVQNIQLGPTLPAFLSPGVAQLLQEQFGLRAVEAVAA